MTLFMKLIHGETRRLLFFFWRITCSFHMFTSLEKKRLGTRWTQRIYESGRELLRSESLCENMKTLANYTRLPGSCHSETPKTCGIQANNRRNQIKWGSELKYTGIKLWLKCRPLILEYAKSCLPSKHCDVYPHLLTSCSIVYVDVHPPWPVHGQKEPEWNSVGRTGHWPQCPPHPNPSPQWR